MKSIIAVVMLTLLRVGASAEIGVSGDPIPDTDLSKVRPYVEDVLLQAADELKLDWTLDTIISASRKDVNDSRYKIEADVEVAGETKKCSIDIWQKPLLNWRKATFSCHPWQKEYVFERGTSNV